MIYEFDECLANSKGVQQESDAKTVMSLLPGCIEVRPASVAEDKTGTDFVATISDKRTVLVDKKSRTPGCSRFWRGDTELALEEWSVMPGGKFRTPAHRQKTGWTLDASKSHELILFTFDQSDSTDVYMFPFQPLRIAFQRHLEEWKRKYKNDTQTSVRGDIGWQSHCIFVPTRVVWDAISFYCLGKASA